MHPGWIHAPPGRHSNQQQVSKLLADLQGHNSVELIQILKYTGCPRKLFSKKAEFFETNAHANTH